MVVLNRRHKGKVGEEEVHGGVQVCRCAFEIMAKMMNRFPRIVPMYMEKKSPYRRCFSFGCSDNPRRKNSKIHV
jgi:hypothetical protein